MQLERKVDSEQRFFSLPGMLLSELVMSPVGMRWADEAMRRLAKKENVLKTVDELVEGLRLVRIGDEENGGLREGGFDSLIDLVEVGVEMMREGEEEAKWVIAGEVIKEDKYDRDSGWKSTQAEAERVFNLDNDDREMRAVARRALGLSFMLKSQREDGGEMSGKYFRIGYSLLMWDYFSLKARQDLSDKLSNSLGVKSEVVGQEMESRFGKLAVVVASLKPKVKIYEEDMLKKS